jgi:translation initiation factor IF-3
MNIDAPELRVVDAESQQVGVLSRDEALSMAREREVDLVMIAAQAKPPVAKLIDFKKFLYQEQKKAQEAKKGVKKTMLFYK